MGSLLGIKSLPSWPDFIYVNSSINVGYKHFLKMNRQIHGVVVYSSGGVGITIWNMVNGLKRYQIILVTSAFLLSVAYLKAFC